jgi:hypothetical protein
VSDTCGTTLVHVVPLEVKTLPDVLGATKLGADVPLPNMTLLAVSVVRLVPPFDTVSGIANDVFHAVPVDTAMPEAGYTVVPVAPLKPE